MNNRMNDLIVEHEHEYSLLRHLDDHITRGKISGPRQPHLYPSEASVKITHPDGKDEILGTCMRQAYLRYAGEPGEPSTPRSEMIFKMGNMVEAVLLDQFKEMGIWVGDDVEFFNNNYNLKGKLDAICKNPSGEQYGVEIKSFYGYYAQKAILGNKSTVGRPKDSQLLQTVVYANEFKNSLNHFKMLYMERGNGMRTEFKVEIGPINGEDRIFVNGQLEERFKVSDIYDRYSELSDYINREEVPPPEFKLYYDDNEIEYYRAQGKVSKTDYEKFKRNSNNRPGDWQCSYCPFKRYCWAS